MVELEINKNAGKQCVKEYSLVQYTPHIHFQADEEGACLRASEVKPKLDRFIRDFTRRQGINIPPQCEMKKMDKEDRDNALNYSMSISGNGNAGKPEFPKFSTYFGNMGGGDNKRCVYYKNGLKLTITSSVKSKGLDLSVLGLGKDEHITKLIEYVLPAFFSFTCFGTRSTKGWGSYGIKGHEYGTNKMCSDPEIADTDYLLRFVDVFYTVELTNQKMPNMDALDKIKTLSNMMKGGINFKGYYKGRIYCYFLEKKIKSDKAFMKSRIFDKSNDDTEYRYVRAMLGLTEGIEFRDQERKGKVKIKDKENQIERFNNPVHFIPTTKHIIILPDAIHEKLSQHTFRMTKGGSKGDIATPVIKENPDNLQNGEFNLVHFLDYFMKSFNSREDFDKAPGEVKALGRTKIKRYAGGKKVE